MRLLKPRIGREEFAFVLKQSGQEFLKVWRCQKSLDLICRDRLKNDPWVLRGLPQIAVQCFPKHVCLVVPGPMQVQRQLIECVDAQSRRCLCRWNLLA